MSANLSGIAKRLKADKGFNQRDWSLLYCCCCHLHISKEGKDEDAGLFSTCTSYSQSYNDDAELSDNQHEVSLTQSINFDGVIEPGTCAGTPFSGAKYAEFGFATTSHVVAAFFKFDKSSAAVTPLPSCFSCRCEKSVRISACRTVFRIMPFFITCTADFRLTLPAETKFLPLHHLNILRPHPISTSVCGTINLILCRMFFILSIPLFLPPIREELGYGTKGDRIGGAALWRHLLGVSKGETENPPQARVALTMPALEFLGTSGFYFFVEADYTSNATSMSV